MEVVVPDELQPGDTFMVQAPRSDLQFSVVVPDGAHGGVMIEISLPLDANEEASVDSETELVEVTVPEGVEPGMLLAVTSAWGGVFEVAVPEGVLPGMTIQIDLPRAAEPVPPMQATEAPSSLERSPLAAAAEPPRTPSRFDAGGGWSSDADRSAAPMPKRSGCSGCSPGVRSGAAAPMPSRLGGRFDNNSSARGASQQYFYAASRTKPPPRTLKASATRSCRAHELRLPRPEEGFSYHIGQCVQIYRAGGGGRRRWC